MIGQKDKVQEENDKLQEIMTMMRETQMYNEMQDNPLRSSTASVTSLNQSMIVGVVADMILKELNTSVQKSAVMEQDVKKVGEELIIQKIQGILDEVAQE